MRFTFQVWWMSDGKTYAQCAGAGTLPDCQRLWARWRDGLAGWPDHVTSDSPAEGPWPRDGEAGRDALQVRSPEGPQEAAA